jgi:hypothetical protein
MKQGADWIKQAQDEWSPMLGYFWRCDAMFRGASKSLVPYQNTWRNVENDRILIFTVERTSKIDREFCRANCPAYRKYPDS